MLSIHVLKLPLRDRGIIGLKFEKLYCFLSGIKRFSVLLAGEGVSRRGKMRQSNGGSAHAKRPIDRARPISTGTKHLHNDTETNVTHRECNLTEASHFSSNNIKYKWFKTKTQCFNNITIKIDLQYILTYSSFLSFTSTY